MKLSRLVLREVFHRKLNFMLSLLGAALAVIVVLATVALLTGYDRRSDALIAEMEAKTTAEMKKLEDEIRKSMKGLGFNIYIFPKDQELSEVYAQGFASKTMPEEFVSRLAESKIVTVNHLLPALTQKLKWPEQERTVVLIGVRGEVPIAHRDQKSPLIDPVAQGKVVLGFELHKAAGLKAGDEVTFMGRTFVVDKTHAERGSKDDITLWMNLTECQELLDQKGRINEIKALECNCATLDRLGEIRAELLEILPDTQIIETGSTALARAEARNQAKATADQQIAAAKRDRENMRVERARMSGLMLPLVALFAMAWVGLLAFTNVRERVSEIGILRALGVRGQTILSAFLGRAIFAGLSGAVIGGLIFALAFPLFRERSFHGFALSELVGTNTWLLAIVLAPVLAAIAAWLPSLWAAQKDPATILRHD